MPADKGRTRSLCGGDRLVLLVPTQRRTVSITIGSTKTARRLLAGIIIGGIVMTLSLFSAAPASAAATCTGSGVSRTCTVTYTYTGTEQRFHVPAGVTSITAVVDGAAGGGVVRLAAIGGNGASVTKTLAVTAGHILFVEVGGPGANSAPAVDSAGGFNGGGLAPVYYGGFYDLTAGGGGGASDVRTVASSAPASLASRLVIAGAGGGGGPDGNGGDAGSPGTPGIYLTYGEAGTATAGGAGGSPAGTPAGNGADGVLGAGGAGATAAGAAGGGGGLYGGGGASTYGGGGGGSSLGTLIGITTDPASVTFTYSAPVAVTTASGPRLPVTGIDPTLPLAAGVLAVLAGLVLRSTRRRRTTN